MRIERNERWLPWMSVMAAVSLLLCLAVYATAQTGTTSKKYLDTTGLETLIAALKKDGDYHLIVKGGVITVFPIQVITLSSSPNPAPPPQSTLREISRTKAAANPEHTRDLIVVTTVVIATHQSVPFSDASSVQDAYQKARDKILDTEAKRTLWKGWMEGTREQLLKMGQEGQLNSADAYVAAVTEIRDGLRDSLEGMGGAAEALDIGQLLKMVIETLELIGSEGVSFSSIIKIVLTLLESMGQRFETGV